MTSPYFLWTSLRSHRLARQHAAFKYYASFSSRQWQTRQGKDKFSRDAKVLGLKSRAAFKLLEMNEKYKLFKAGQTVVDLGYAPGSWSQVAFDRTRPGGRTIGIDILPAQPPKGVSTIQGDFLSESVRQKVRNLLADPDQGRPLEEQPLGVSFESEAITAGDFDSPSDRVQSNEWRPEHGGSSPAVNDRYGGTVDVVLSDMSAPWDITSGFWKRSLSDPYYRMMNISGTSFRDHAGSMDLCEAALRFCVDCLREGGSFICKFYQGSEDKSFERRLKAMFVKVHREKPEASRGESKEGYFVAIRRRESISLKDIFGAVDG
ncbi:2' O-ribose methyltransferase [Thelotrema lepadinum]|nr:2' O-ribose methyltransferase [Thelotrema lepadinum]